MNIDKSVIFDGLRSLTTKSSSTSTPWKALKLALNLIFFVCMKPTFPSMIITFLLRDLTKLLAGCRNLRIVRNGVRYAAVINNAPILPHLQLLALGC